MGIGLLALSFAGINEILQDLALHKEYLYLNYLPLGNYSITGIGLYYFVVYLLNPNYNFGKKDYWIITPFMLGFLLHLVVYVAYIIHPFSKENTPTFFYCSNLLFNYLPIAYFFWVCFSLLKKVNLYHQNLLDNFSDTEGKDLYWLRNLLYILLVFSVFLLFIITLIFIYDERLWPFYFVWIFSTCLMTWLAYFVILRRDVFMIPIFENAPSQVEKPILSDKTEEHYQNLLEVIQKEKLYQDAQLSMDTLAEKTTLSNGYLSKIINQKEGKNFYDFINAYRVKEVKANLTNPNYAHYSILGIGLEAGFKSKSTFNAVFKKMTGMTPSAYKKSLSPITHH